MHSQAKVERVDLVFEEDGQTRMLFMAECHSYHCFNYGNDRPRRITVRAWWSKAAIDEIDRAALERPCVLNPHDERKTVFRGKIRDIIPVTLPDYANRCTAELSFDGMPETIGKELEDWYRKK